MSKHVAVCSIKITTITFLQTEKKTPLYTELFKHYSGLIDNLTITLIIILQQLEENCH